MDICKMRVEISMDKVFRGYVEDYSEMSDTTMPQAYQELLMIGLACSNADFARPPADVDELQSLTDDKIDIEEVLGD